MFQGIAKIKSSRKESFTDEVTKKVVTYYRIDYSVGAIEVNNMPATSQWENVDGKECVLTITSKQKAVNNKIVNEFKVSDCKLK